MDITIIFILWRHHQVVTMHDWAVWELQQQQFSSRVYGYGQFIAPSD